VYDDIRAKLVPWCPEKEVAFIQDHDTDAARMPCSRRCVREILRSLGQHSENGEGTSVRHRLVALHLDAPWRPSDIEQREAVFSPGQHQQFVGIFHM
jgi:hypothetical protein